MAKLHFITFLKTCTYNDGKKQLSTTTCRMFVNYFGSSLAKAVRDGLIEQNPFLLLEAKEKPQKRVAEREFLTIEEIKKVMNTPCRTLRLLMHKINLISEKQYILLCF